SMNRGIFFSGLMLLFLHEERFQNHHIGHHEDKQRKPFSVVC
mgnify:CR=1